MFSCRATTTRLCFTAMRYMRRARKQCSAFGRNAQKTETVFRTLVHFLGAIWNFIRKSNSPWHFESSVAMTRRRKRWPLHQTNCRRQRSHFKAPWEPSRSGPLGRWAEPHRLSENKHCCSSRGQPSPLASRSPESPPSVNAGEEMPCQNVSVTNHSAIPFARARNAHRSNILGFSRLKCPCDWHDTPHTPARTMDPLSRPASPAPGTSNICAPLTCVDINSLKLYKQT